jgi:hypothetical protein
MTEDDLLAVASAIRPHLPNLIDGDPSAVDEQIQRLLDRAAQGEEVKQPLLRLLAQDAATREWARKALTVPKELRTYEPQPGQVRLPALLYRCPRCGRPWYRFSVLDPVPTCEQDQIPYVSTPDA